MNKILALKVQSLEKENVDIKTELESLSKSNKKSNSENLKANSEASKIKEEKRVLQIKHEKVCAEIKIVNNEKEDLVKKCHALSVADKTKQKEIFEAQKRFNMKNEELKNKVIDLEVFREQKLTEERAFKHQEKKIEKKDKRELPKEAKLKVDEMKFIRTGAKCLDTNGNEALKVTIEEENVETKNVDKDQRLDVEIKGEANTEKNLSANELEHSDQKMATLKNIIEVNTTKSDAIRAMTKAVCAVMTS